MLRVSEHTGVGYSSSSPRFREVLSALVVFFSALATGVVSGLIASRGEPLFAGVVAGAAAAFWIVGQRTWLLWICIVGGLVIVGATRLYIPAIQQVRWLLAPLSLLLVAHTVLALVDREGRSAMARVPDIVWWSAAFLVATLGFTLFTNPDPSRLLVGVKGYFQVWGLVFALAFIPWRSSTIDAIPRVLLAIALVQIPFVLHQLLVLVPSRAGIGDGIVAVDVIAGTFGASLEGGGANATLAAFLVMALAGCISAVQYRAMPAWWLIALVPVLLFPMLVNMAKVSVLYILAAFGVLFYRDLLLNPTRFLAGLAGIALLAAALIAAFVINAPENAGVDDWQSLVEYTYQSNIEEDEVAGQLTRASTLGYWAEMHWPSDIRGMLFGHGIGVTRVADSADPFEATVALQQEGAPLFLDLTIKPGTTTVAAVLWEGGVVSFALLIGLLGSAYRSAGRSAAAYRDIPERAAALRAVQACIAVFFITLFHKNMFVFDVIYQTLLMVVLGYTAYWDRVRPEIPDSRSQP